MRIAAIVICSVFSLTSAAYVQTLLNGHFATPYNYVDANTSVADKWTHFRLSMNPQFKQSDFEQMPGGPGGQVSCQQIWADWSTYDAGVYQQITGATVGQTYRLTGWLLSIYRHGQTNDPPYQDGSIYQKLGVDPTGGTNPASANVVWSWDDPLDRRWRELVVDVAAQSSTITVFARTRNLYASTNCLSFLDAFTLVTADPVKITNLAVRPATTYATISWTTDVPATSTVNLWQYRGTVAGATTVTDSVYKTAHSLTVTGLSAGKQYWFKVSSSATGKSTGISCGNSSINPFTTMSGQQFATLAAAKNNPDGTVVYVRDLLVTGATTQFGSFFFLEQQDRMSGIKVDKGGLTVTGGKLLDISGTLATTAGERRLASPRICVVSSAASLAPLAMATSAVGGSSLNAYTPGITGGTGPNNLGLLVKVWGRITFADNTVGNRVFYVDDGRGLEDGTSTGRKGLRISWLNMAGVVAPVVGKYAVLAGMSSCFQEGGRTLPQVLLRSSADFQQF